MKRISLAIFSILLTTGILAQNEVDALRYSQNYFGGTARSVAMAGAFGALGGDISTLSTNPAGLGLYRQSEFTFTPTIFVQTTEADYLKNTYDDTKYNFNFNNLGFVFAYNGGSNGWEGFSFGISYNRLNTFHQNIIMGGDMIVPNTNVPHSLLDNFTYYANNPNMEWSDYYEGLAYEAYILPWDPDSGLYWNDFNNSGYGQNQQRTIKREGGIGEYCLSFGANYSHTLYVGATVGIQRVRFDNYVIHTENDAYNTIDTVAGFTFKETFRTRGTGFNFKFGLIYKPVDFVRIGGAIHTPTFYNLNDEYFTSIDAAFDDGGPNEFVRSPLGFFEYKLRTPFKALGSIAFQAGDVALISFDYEYLDYSNADLDATDDNFTDANENIQENYTKAHNFKGGAEVRFGPMSVRGGYAYYMSPFESSQVNKDAYTSFITGGLGFRSENFFIDFAYVYGMHNEKYYLYYLPEEVDPADLSSTYNKFLLTLGFRF